MTDKIKNTIVTFPFGFVFTPKDFPIEVSKQPTVNRVLNLLVAKGNIRRLSNGKITGYSIFNNLELTTQVPFTMQIGKKMQNKFILHFVRNASINKSITKFL
ncbi:MAG: hypothetical protein LBV69_05230 [Bacteroidales bacterium]|jgi:predicted transcriptional regulator|nr:hypothetical protein [Bacteroidales bacterium]